jgi:hypothetical protein
LPIVARRLSVIHVVRKVERHPELVLDGLSQENVQAGLGRSINLRQIAEMLDRMIFGRARVDEAGLLAANLFRDLVGEAVGVLVTRHPRIQAIITVCLRESPKQLQIVMKETMVAEPGCRDGVNHDSAPPGEIVHHLERVVLVEDVFAGPDIGDEVETPVIY